MQARLENRAMIVVLVVMTLAATLHAADPLHQKVNGPTALAFDPSGNLYIYESRARRILRLSADRMQLSQFAGNGHQCCTEENALAGHTSVDSIESLAFDLDGNLYLGGTSIRLIRAKDHRISTVWNRHDFGETVGVPTKIANLSDASGIIVSPDGEILIASSGLSLVLGLGGASPRIVAGTLYRGGFYGDGGAATEARLDSPIALARNGYDLFIADRGNNRVRKVDLKIGIIDTVAGNGKRSSGDGGPAKSAGISWPYYLAVDPAGNLFLAENGLHTVRRVDAANGIIETYVGNGHDGDSGDEGPAVQAEINPSGLAVDREGNLYISDLEHNRVRRVDAKTGIITTVAGNGLPHPKRIRRHIE